MVARGQAVIVVCFFVRAFFQLLTFVVVARHMDVADYGYVVIVSALAGAFSPIALFGVEQHAFREISLSPDRLAVIWPSLLGVVLVAIPVTLFAGGLTYFFSGVGYSALFICILLFVADSYLFRVNETLARLLQALDGAGGLIGVRLGLSATRFAGAIVWLFFCADSLALWAVVYFLASIIWIFSAALFWLREWPGLLVRPRLQKEIVFRALPFAFSGVAERARADLDKPLQSQFGGLANASGVSVAARVSDFFVLPFVALITVFQRKWVVDSSYGVDKFLRANLYQCVMLVFGALMSGGAMYIFAQFIPWIIGSKYAMTVSLVQAFAFFPLIVVLRYIFVTCLIGRKLDSWLMLSFFAALIVNFLLNFMLIPRVGMIGSVWAAYAGEACIVLLVGAVIFKDKLQNSHESAS